MSGIRRLRSQVDHIDRSLVAIDGNISEIVNSDITRDIVSSLKRSTEAIKSQVIPLGGVDGIHDTMEDLQAELQNSAEITDAIHRGVAAGSPWRDEDDDETMMRELDEILGLPVGAGAPPSLMPPILEDAPPIHQGLISRRGAALEEEEEEPHHRHQAMLG